MVVKTRTTHLGCQYTTVVRSGRDGLETEIILQAEDLPPSNKLIELEDEDTGRWLV